MDMELDYTYLFLSLIFGSIGCGYFIYGKKQGKPMALVAGLLLMGCPYFLPSVLSMVIVSCLFMVFPFVVSRFWGI